MRKLVLAAVAAAFTATTVAAPADARHRRYRHHDRIDGGDIVAGAAVVGAIAILASSSNEKRRRKQDAAVDRCTSEAENRTGGRVTDILSVGRRNGYHTVDGVVDGEAGAGLDFRCTVRNGSIYSFRTRSDPD